jgi:predicted amidohydrolase YtcJ
VKAVLDGYATARAKNGPRDSRHRIEHIEVVRAADIPRFRELGVIASMQPPHPPGNAGLPLEPTVSRIGRDKWRLAYAWRTLKQAGAHVVFASDWPVSPIDPMLGLKCATTRGVWADGLPDQRFSLHEAIAGYTAEGAYAEFAEARKGRLKPGFFGDLVVLDADIERIDPEELDTVKPLATVCGGRVTFEG